MDYRVKIAFGIAMSTIGFASFAAGQTTKRCPAEDMGCNSQNYEHKVKERIDQGRQEVRETNSPVNKAKAVGSTIKDCTDCGMKVITDSVKSAGDGSEGNAAGK